MKILVTDDEPHIRQVLSEFLTKEGHEVTTAEDGRDALLKYKSGEFAVVFMDVKMPGVDGVEAFRIIKQTNPDTKVIIISGLVDDETFDRAVTISPDAVEGFLPKPFKPDDIRKCLARITEGNKWQGFTLNEKQQAAMNKLSSDCALNTSVAFSKVLQREAKTTLNGVTVQSLSQLAGAAPQKELSYVCMNVISIGQVSGRVFISLTWEQGLNLVDVLQKREIGVTRIFDDRSRNNLLVAANIISGAYLNAVAQMLKLTAQPSMPEIIFEQKSKALAAIEKQINAGMSDNKYVFTVQSNIAMVDPKIEFDVVFIPTYESFKLIMQKMGALDK